ncbi:MAG TPA: hypothetical protein VG826_22675 [Pirellulales bacterium]|nr:hypothetical protein [Pirellulales bacterium]
MPKPIFIVCAQSVIEDKTTNNVSILNVLEKISYIKRKPSDDQPVTQFNCNVLAVWRRETSDINVEFETEFSLILPSSGDIHSLASSPFTFPEDKELWRFNLMFSGMPPIDGDGTLIFRHGLRKKAASEWLYQSYPVSVEALKTENESAQKATRK